MLAEKLGYLMIDTGGMYRAVTYAAIQRGIDCTDEAAVVALAMQLDIEMQPAAFIDDGRLCTVLVDGEDVTWKLRTGPIDKNVSQVSAYKQVREEMVRRQRVIGERGGVVMVGRDIGTVVLPNAPIKLYMVASAAERARRRWEERKDIDTGVTFEKILQGIERRDKFDSTRKHSPLAPADDAIIVDSTSKPPDDLLDEILNLEQFQHILEN